MANGRNINTFTSGVNIPGWATEAYKSTTSDIDSIVKEITGEIRAKRKDEMAFALETARVAQNQDRIDLAEEKFEADKIKEDFEYEKDSLDILLGSIDKTPDGFRQMESILNRRRASENPRVTEYREGVTSNIARLKTNYGDSRENIRNTFFNGLSDDQLEEDGRINLLDSYQLMNAKDPQWSKSMTTVMLQREFPELNPTFLAEQKMTIKTMGEIQYEMFSSKPNSANFKKYKSAYDELKSQLVSMPNSGITTTIDLSSDYSKKTGIPLSAVKNRIDLGELSQEDMAAELSGVGKLEKIDKSEGYLEGLGDYVSEIFEDISFGDMAGQGDKDIATIARYLNRPDSPLGTISRFLGREDTDLTQELDKAVGILGEEAAEGWKGIKEGVPVLAEVAIEGFKELPDITQETYSEFASNHPNVSSGLGKVGTIAAAVNPIIGTIAYSQASPEQKDKVKQFAIDSYNEAAPIVRDMAYLALDKTDDAMQAGVDFATEKFTGAVKAVHGARGPKMALRRGMEVMSTLPHRAIEFFNFNRNTDIDKYVEQGMSYDDAYAQALNDAVSRGGEYFATSAWKKGEDAPAKHIYKKTLVDYASNKNLWMVDRGPFKKGGSAIPENMKDAPSKFVNPRWIAWETNNLEKKIHEQYANVTDANNQEPTIAARSMSNIKNTSSDIVKELRKIKNEIKKSPSIAKGEMTVKEEVIDKLISQALRLKNPKDALKKYYEEFNKYKFSPTSVGTFNMPVPQDTSSNTMDMMFDSFLQQN